jgi:IS30 family transposase
MKKKSKPKKSYRLSAKEIATVKSMTKAGATMRQIAKKIDRVPSTVWRWQHSTAKL